MRYLSLVALALVVGATACDSVVTSPDAMPDVSLRYDPFGSNPPPPPIDTGTAPTAQYSFLVFSVKYFFNPVGNSGYLMFDNTQEGSTEVDKNAQVRYSNGVFSGKGILTTDVNGEDEGGILVLNLALVDGSLSSFAACGTEAPVGDVTREDRPETGCFRLTFDGVTVDGVETRLTFEPTCRSGDTRTHCIRSEID